MSSKASLEPLLETLIPTWNDTLPPALVGLAASLLAQSRSKASTLKAEEEIGRSYACAHLACERLKRSLNLPKIVAHPPCQPRVYKKLYQYLDQALPAKQVLRGGQAGTVSNLDKHPANAPPPVQRHINVPTPSKKRALEGLSGKEASYDTEGVPQWVFTKIRYLCKMMNKPTAVPHAFAGISSVLQPKPASASAKRKRKSTESALQSISEAETPAYIVAVLLCVLAQLSGRNGIDLEERRDWQDAAVVGLVGQQTAREEQRRELHSRVTDLLSNSEESWSDMEWFRNIGPEEPHDAEDGTDSLEQEEESDARDATSGSTSRTYSGGPLRFGLGTMMQDRIDWLSDERRENYVRWKAGIMAKIEQIERRKASTKRPV